ncbi:hypothetical protein [Paenibacillus agilis]|uniref:Uncharacterized protein n=1 Tax=Paenibacillus agilis TaxID=3020863 RepID=A0A559IXZ1_9BACL|nr:hypothetical protein [Paenibacillus agilis]TVX92502.1 hypothetical protein FPZ44_05200 [Paenibacillus agilis]
MEYHTKVIDISPIIEEEIILEINKERVVAFINYCPYEIRKGEQYTIELELTILDEFIIRHLDAEKGVEQIEDGFAHLIRGMLDIDSATIDAGILFEIDREFLFDYGYLHNQNVQIRVDRITADFIG